MKNIIWQMFSETGDVETYLLFKQLENDIDETDDNNENVTPEFTLHKTKM